MSTMVQDLDRSLALYTALRFKPERRDGGFAALRWEDRRLFLDQRSDLPSLSGPARGNVRILTGDVDAVWAVAQTLGLPAEQSIADRFYGLRDFTVLDPDLRDCGARPAHITKAVPQPEPSLHLPIHGTLTRCVPWPLLFF